MTDYSLNQFVSSGTAAQRAAFTPNPATPAAGNSPSYLWLERDTSDTYAWNFAGAAWIKVNANIATAGIINSAVTLAKIANAAASSKLLGSGASGSGSPYAELTLGTGLSMSGTTLNVTGGTGTVTSVTAGTGLSGGAITTTGTIAINATITPQGRLTLVSATPVMTSDQTAKTTVYYAEYTGNRASVWDGTNMVPLTFSNLSCILDATNHLLENVYDIYMYDSGSSTAALGASPAWVNTATVTWTSASPGVCSWTAHGLYEGAPVIFTAGTSTPTGITAGTTYYVSKTGLAANSFSVSTTIANAAAGTNVNTSSTGVGTQTATNHTTKRGTGAGTTELELKNGLWVNKNAITLFNNSVSSGSIAADKCTYLGSIYCTANGQTGMAFKPAAAAGGNNNFLGVYNAYNRVATFSDSHDSTASWLYGTATWRAQNAAGTGSGVTNRISWLDGLQQSFAYASGMCSVSGVAGAVWGGIGVVVNSTTATPAVSAGNALTGDSAEIIVDEFAPLLGVNFAQMVEISSAANTTFKGSGPVAQSQKLSLRVDM